MTNHHEHFWWRFFPKKKLSQIYVSVLIRSFAISLISLFIPLYLYKELSYTLEQTLLFFIFYAVIFAVSTPLAAKFSARYGIKHAILLSVPFFLIFVLLLYFLPLIKIPLVIVSAFLGLYVAFYWMGFHLVFYHNSNHKHRGEAFGKRRSVSIFGTMLGPIFGGFIIKYVGFYLVFLIIILLMFISAFFLFLSKDKHVKYDFSVRSIFNGKYWKDSLFFVSRGTYAIAAGVIWPLFIFFIVDDYFILGIVGTLASGMSVILVWFTGKYSDLIGKRKIVRWTVWFESLSWFLRALVNNTLQVFGVTLLGGLTYGIFEAPLGALEYDKARGNITEYFVSREIFICLGRILILTFVLITDSLSGGMILHGFASLAALLF